MVNIFKKYQRNLSMFVQKGVGRLSQKCICMYRVRWVDQNMIILSIHTLWMTPISIQKANLENFHNIIINCRGNLHLTLGGKHISSFT